MGLVALAALGLATMHDEPLPVVVSMVLLGAGVAAAFAAMAALITESVRPTETGVATGMNTVMRTVGGVIGGQIGAAILTSYAVGGGLPEEQAYTIAFGAERRRRGCRDLRRGLHHGAVRARRQPTPAEALD